MNLAACFVINPVDCFIARIRNLPLVFGKLDARNKCIARLLLLQAYIRRRMQDGLLIVIRLVPTPHEPMAAPCALSDSIRYSSRSLDAHMTASGNPASSSIFLAFFERYDKISAVQTYSVHL